MVPSPRSRPPPLHLEKNTYDSYFPVQDWPPPRYRFRRILILVMGLFALAAFLLLAPYGTAVPSYVPGSIFKPKNGSDPFHGKTLAPSNVSVVTGLFRQDDPDLDEEGYDMLKDGFGLLDKSADRWRKFTK